MAWLLGPAGKGKVALVILVPTIVLIVINAGFHLSAAYWVSRGEYRVRQVFGAIFCLTGILCAGLAVVLLLLLDPIQRVVYRGLSIPIVLVSCASLPALLLIFFTESVWVALDRSAVLFRVRLWQVAVYFPFGVLAVGVFGWGVFGAALAFTLGLWAGAAIVLVEAFRSASGPWGPSLPLVREGLRFGLASHPGNLAEYALMRGDTFLLGYLVEFSRLGLYSVAVPAAELVWYLSAAVRPVLFARTARAAAEDSNAVTPFVVRGVLLLSALAAVVVFAAGVVVLRTVLPTFAPAIPVLGILLVATVVGMVFQLVRTDLIARGLSKSASRLAMAILPFGLVIYVVLIRWEGIIGAALATLVIYAAESTAALLLYARLTGVAPRRMFVPERGDARRFLDALRSAL
jgi:O-antigen/teichoic acid export membrane protein